MSIDTVAVWHQVAKNRDVAGLDSLLHRDVVFHSPVVHSPQVGKSITTQYLAAAFQVFFNDSFVYVREVHGQGHAVLEFNVEIQGIVVNGVDMISWDQDGLITDFKVMVRPLKGVNLIHQNMGAMLQAQSS
jgi:hypothetical protein